MSLPLPYDDDIDPDLDITGTDPADDDAAIDPALDDDGFDDLEPAEDPEAEEGDEAEIDSPEPRLTGT